MKQDLGRVDAIFFEVVGVGALALFGGLVALILALAPKCDDHVVKYLASPTGEYRALLIKSRCRVTTRPAYHLEVLRSDERSGSRVSPLSVQPPYYAGQGFTYRDYPEIARIGLAWLHDTLETSVDSRANVRRWTVGVPDGVTLGVKTRYEPSPPR